MGKSMKNASRRMSVKFSNVREYDFGEDAKAGTCERLKNMRAKGSSLRPVGQLLPIGVLDEGDSVLALHRCHDGIHLITTNGNTLKWHGTINGDDYDSVGTVIGELPRQATCAESLGDFVMVGCEAGDVCLHYENGRYALLSRDDAIPQLRISARQLGTISASVKKYSFEGEYSRWQKPLDDADVSAVSANIQEAYSALKERAELAGAYLQPILCRYAVRLYDNSYLWVSQPFLLGNGVQCSGEYRPEVENDGTHYTAVGEYSLSAAMYGLSIDGLSGTGKAWDNVVKSVDILVSDEMEPILRSQQPDYRCETTTTGTKKQYLMLRMKTADLGQMIRDLVTGTSWSVAYRITDLAALRQGEVRTIASTGKVSADTLTAGVESMSGRRCSTTLLTHNRRMFAAGRKSLLRYGWDNLGVVNVDKTAGGTFEIAAAATLITSQGDARTVWHATGTGKAVSLNPIVAYPDVRATKIDVAVRNSTGEVLTATIQLQAESAAGMSYAVSDDLQPTTLTEESGGTLEVPEEENMTENTDGSVTESCELNPLVMKATHSVCAGHIRQLGASLHHSNNVIGTPMYVFADSGVYALPYRTVSSTYSPAVIISRYVIAENVVPVNTDVTLCFASEGGQLCSIDRYKVSVVLKKSGDIKALAYSLDDRELWIQNTDGAITVLTADGSTFTRGESFDSLFSSTADVPIAIASTGAIYRIGDEVENLSDVELITQPFSPADAGWFRPKSVALDIMAASINAEVRIYGDTGHNCHGMMLCRLKLSGSINSPFWARVYSPAVRKMRVEIKGKMSSDAILGGMSVNYDKIY